MFMSNEEKLDKIYESVNEIKIQLAKTVVYSESHSNKLADHEAKINILDAHRNTIMGKQTVFSAIFGSIGGSLMHLFK